MLKQVSFQVDYAPVHITKWKSPRTGLQLTYINRASPTVNGYFALATEISDNSGCPHTLEHLVFMGSKKYPYKGLLDNLGNRMYSSTNAWTGIDQTVYTLVTAGWDGFKTLLPVYLEHLLDPTLTDEACLTEVYHIDGEGKEKGVVFSEMQDIEHSSWFVAFLKMQQTLFSEKSGYSSETGGLTSELRSLTNKRIREFHKSMYRPDNLAVVITGSLDEDELLKIMEEFDRALEVPTTPFKRPFVDSPEDMPLEKTVVVEVEFPSKDESMGELIIGWIGPRAQDSLINLAVDMIGSYLTESAISLLNKTLVEVADPLATSISYSTDDYLRTVLYLNASDVPTDRLGELDTRIKELLAGQNETNFDLTYIRELVAQQKLKFAADCETSMQKFANIAVSEFIYGNPDGSDLVQWTKSLDEFDDLLAWDTAQWLDVIQEQFVKNHSASVLAIPSSSLNKAQKEASRERDSSIREKYGPEGLRKLGEVLEAAQQVNDKPIPDDLLLSFEKPDPSKIKFLTSTSYSGGDTSIAVDGCYDGTFEGESPLFFHFEHYPSQFTHVNIVASSTEIDPSLLPYMAIIEEVFSLSVQTPDEYIPYDKVIAGLNNDLIDFRLDNGISSQLYELINVSVQFESSKYSSAISWLTKILKYAVFEEARVKVIVDKIVNSLADKKREGEYMMHSCQYRTMFTTKSLRHAQDSIHTEPFYKNIQASIENGKFEPIKKDLETLMAQLFCVSNMKVFVVGNCEGLENPVDSWKSLAEAFKNDKPPVPFNELPRAFQFESEVAAQCSGRAFLVASPAAKSTHLVTMARIPTDYNHPDIYKIALATEFLVAVEGPLWRAVRGTGLAYGANIRRHVESGMLEFSVYRGADPQQAWKVTKQIVADFAEGVTEIDTLSLENAIASIVSAFASSEENPSDAAYQKILDNVFKRRGPSYITHFLREMQKLSVADVRYAISTYFVPMFDPARSVVFSSIPAEKRDDFEEFYTELGYAVSTEEVTGAGEESEDEGSECDSDCESDCEGHDYESESE